MYTSAVDNTAHGVRLTLDPEAAVAVAAVVAAISSNMQHSNRATTNKYQLRRLPLHTNRRVPRKLLEVAGVSPRGGTVEVKLAVQVPAIETNHDTQKKQQNKTKRVRVFCEFSRQSKRRDKRQQPSKHDKAIRGIRVWCLPTSQALAAAPPLAVRPRDPPALSLQAATATPERSRASFLPKPSAAR